MGWAGFGLSWVKGWVDFWFWVGFWIGLVSGCVGSVLISRFVRLFDFGLVLLVKLDWVWFWVELS